VGPTIITSRAPFQPVPIHFIKNTSALLLLSVCVCVSENLAVNSDAVQSGGGNLKTNNETDGQTQKPKSEIHWWRILNYCGSSGHFLEFSSHFSDAWMCDLKQLNDICVGLFWISIPIISFLFCCRFSCKPINCVAC
jgi:hypothetical protein